MMTLHRVVAQARKELIEIRRDPVAMGLAFILPVTLIFLLGTAISLTVKNIPVVLRDLDQTPMSRSLADALRTSITVRLVAGSTTRPSEEAVLSGQARACVIIPQHFEKNLLHGRAADVQVQIDAADANTANALGGSLNAIVHEWNGALSPRAATTQLVAQARMLYNPGLREVDFIAPGALVVSIALMPPLLTALAMSRERERRTIQQVYVCGVSALEYLLGYMVAFTCIAALDWVLGLGICYGIFGLGLQGGVAAFLFGTVCYLVCVIAFGAMVGATAHDQMGAIEVMQLGGFLMSFLLSGFIFPLANIPPWLRWLSVVTPARYYLDIVRDGFLRGGGWASVGPQIGALVTLSGIFLYVAWVRMRHMQLDL